jgi:glycosyltransferase involved in cell wall biosynthesis
MEQWGIAPVDRVILFMGTIYKFSGLDRVIEGFPDILSRCARAKLLIVGMGEDETRLKELAVRTGVSGSVVFAGLQPYSLLPDVIRSSDVCINPFELNGITRNILPTKLFQYMACEKPVLATSLPGTLTFLEGEEQGIVYAELSNFNRVLGDLLVDPEWCSRLGRRGHEAAQQYDWTAIAKNMESLLRGLAS